MDLSNFFHFFVAFFIPLGWGVIFFPIRKKIFRSSTHLLQWILGISLVCVCAKEFFDSAPSVNDLVSDLLGYFFGVAFLFSTFHWRARRIDRAVERTIENQSMSLRTTLKFVERIERKSGDFYSSYAKKLRDIRASAICELLARDSYARANKTYYLLSSWKKKEEPLGFFEAMEKQFLGDETFALAIQEHYRPEQVMERALLFEKTKLLALTKFESAFAEDWKLFQFEGVLDELRAQIKKLEGYLQEKQNAARLEQTQH